MHDTQNSIMPAAKRIPWNKGKLTGAKPPLRPKHVWAIRTKLQMERQTRDLALFNLAIDSKLRAATLSLSKSMTLRPTAMPPIEQPYARGKRGGLCALNSPSKPEMPSTITSEWQARHRASFYSPVAGRDKA